VKNHSVYVKNFITFRVCDGIRLCITKVERFNVLLTVCPIATPTVRKTGVGPRISQRLRIVYGIPSQLILRMVIIPAIITNKKSRLLKVNNFILQLMERVPKTATIAESKSFTACGVRVSQF
jgi:hypothetical protein